MLEQLAHEEHEVWSHWMRYLFSKCRPAPDGGLVIPPELVERWTRQAQTRYADLSEREKQSDRDVVVEHHKCLSTLISVK